MATLRAISTISQALCGLLTSARPTTGDLKDTVVSLYLAEDFKKAIKVPTVSVFVYRATISTARRNLPPRIGSDGQKYRSPLPLDIHFMLTPWASKPEVQHLLLAWMMRALEDMPALSAGFLNNFDAGNAPFGAEETVELVYEPTSIADMLSIWEVGKPNVQVSVTYVARMVLIDSTVPLIEGPPVQTRV